MKKRWCLNNYVKFTCRVLYYNRWIMNGDDMGMDQYLLIPFLGEWTSIYQLFWCELQGYKVLTRCHMIKGKWYYKLKRYVFCSKDDVWSDGSQGHSLGTVGYGLCVKHWGANGPTESKCLIRDDVCISSSSGGGSFWRTLNVDPSTYLADWMSNKSAKKCESFGSKKTWPSPGRGLGPFFSPGRSRLTSSRPQQTQDPWPVGLQGLQTLETRGAAVLLKCHAQKNLPLDHLKKDHLQINPTNIIRWVLQETYKSPIS